MLGEPDWTAIRETPHAGLGSAALGDRLQILDGRECVAPPPV
jgi:hypothetical protein